MPHKNLITYAENVTSYLQATVLRARGADGPRASYGDGESICVAKLIASYRLARQISFNMSDINIMSEDTEETKVTEEAEVDEKVS